MIKTLRKPTNLKEIISLSLPCMGEQFLIVLMNLLSTAIVGHLGSVQLTASSMVGTMLNWLQFVFTGLSVGATVVIARIYGAGDREGVRNCFYHCVSIAAALGFTLMFFLVTCSNFLTNLFYGGAAPELMQNIRLYFSYAMYSVPFISIFTVTNASVRGVGDNKMPLISSTFLNVLYVILAYLFIYGIPSLSIPAMGLKGAGIALISARFISCIFSFLYIYITKSPVIYTGSNEKSKFKGFSLTLTKRIFNIGLPSCAEQFIFQAGFVIMQSLLIPYGTTLQSGYSIASNINGLVCTVSNGISTALTTLISQYLARRDFSGTKEILHTTKFLTAAFFIPYIIIMFGVSQLLTGVYTNEPEVISSAKLFSGCLSLMQLPLIYSTILGAILRGAGDAKYIAVTATVAMWLGRILVMYIFVRLNINGYAALVAAMAADFVTRAVMYHLRTNKEDWLYLKV